MAIAGRVVTGALGLWLTALILGGLGLQPLAGLPIVRDLGAGEAAPPALPKRVQTAVSRGATVAPAARAVHAPSVARPQIRTTPATTPGQGNTTTGQRPVSPLPAPSHQATSPSTTAPGQTRTPPGQTKTAPGPPTTTPGTTPGAKGNNGKAPGVTGTVTSP